MSSIWSNGEATTNNSATVSCHSLDRDVDDAERGVFDSTHTLPVIQPSTTSSATVSCHSLDRDVDDAERGVFNSTQTLPVIQPSTVYVEEKKQAHSDVVEIRDPVAAKKPAPPKQKISRWTLANLWFNTYRKFFTFVTLLNLTGIIMASLNRFPYAENHLGALVLGNLLCAILMRNELFLRFLYIISIYGLRGVRDFLSYSQNRH